MRTIITDADPAAIAELAGVAWRKPTPECLVTFGTYQGVLVGVEPAGKLWAVHVDDEKAEAALVSMLADHRVFGAEVFEAVAGLGVPAIGGGDVEQLIDKAKAVAVDKEGKAKPLTDAEAATALTAARDGKEVRP